MLIQQLWKYQLAWDDPVPFELQNAWVTYTKQLPLLNNIKFKRCIILENSKEVQLHGFCDASERAYGACLYLKSTDKDGKSYISLVCSKSRVAPIKTTTLPRLELCAALLLANLYSNASHSLDIPSCKNFFWSDSTITLNWINTPPYLLETFLANRVSAIQNKTQIQCWRHVTTNSNPADLLSRGMSPQEFLQSSLWSQGPQWLIHEEPAWPNLSFAMTEIHGLRKAKPIVSLKITQTEGNLLTKYSTFQKLRNVVAYCLRFISNSKNKDQGCRTKGPLEQCEFDAALTTIIKLTQAETFSSEMCTLSKNQNVCKNSSLASLNPFMDKGLIKVGGRLSQAEIPESQKHPIVLPKTHHVTKFIIRDEHLKRLHAGVNATLYGVRELFWPIDGRNTTRHIIRQCVKCIRAKPSEYK